MAIMKPRATTPKRVTIVRDAGQSAGLAACEAVAHPGLGEEVPGLAGVGLQLPPQLAHIDAQVVGLLVVRRAPDVLEELGLGDEPARVADEHLEDLPLGT